MCGQLYVNERAREKRKSKEKNKMYESGYYTLVKEDEHPLAAGNALVRRMLKISKNW